MKLLRCSVRIALTAVASTLCVTHAAAQIRVGVVLSTTGPAASLGIPEKNTVRLFPKEYQTHGIANNDVLRVGGKDLERTLRAAGPVLVARQFPENAPPKATALDC